MAEDIKLESEMSPEELAEITASEDFILGFKEEDYDDPDKLAELKQHQEKLKTTVHQKRHYRDKYQEAIKPPEKKPEEKKPEKKEVSTTPEKKGIERTDLVEFRQDHPELSKEVAKEVAEHATAYGISLEEALKKPIIQKYIQDQNTKNDVEDAGITPGNRAGSGLEKKDWSSASEAEITAARNKILQGGN
jgi:hypothetical protein